MSADDVENMNTYQLRTRETGGAVTETIKGRHKISRVHWTEFQPEVLFRLQIHVLQIHLTR